MRICTTIEELKMHAEVSNGFDPANLLTAESDVEPFVRRFLSDEEYDIFLENYDNDALTDEQLKLKPFLQKAVVSLSMIIWVGGVGQHEISDAGVHLNLSKDRKTAFQWQIVDLQKEFAKRGYKALQNMLLFLRKNESDYPMWASSDARKEYFRYFINDAVDFSKNYQIRDNYSFFLFLRETMDFVEENYILPLLGQPLFDEIKVQILDNDVSDENDIILKWIKRAVAAKTIHHAVPKLANAVDEFGIQENFVSQIMRSDASQPARNELISLLIRETDKSGESYLYRIRKHLIDNASDYPLYVVPTNTSLAINNPDSKFFTVL